ncbi:MAG: ATP-binding cassette domain-containing protein [Acidobacteria bacterium]|nr:ATP-binding cassette domain-containing protein [Acidobacteriota bacterium]
MTHALELTNVTKRYVGHLAVDGLSLSVPRGSIYGILGPNGAGKSTTLRMVMNIIARDSGSIAVLGEDPARDRRVLRRVGYLPEERGLYKKMTALDVIVFFGALRGMSEAAAREDGVRWLDRMGLGQWQRAKVETLSKGMQQKVQFITTVIHQPDLLILDEPASGLDPVNQEVLRDTVLGARTEGRTVVFSTHNMDQAEQLCDYVCIIAQGRKVLDGDLREIRRSHAGHRYHVEFDSVTPVVLDVMSRNPVLRAATRSGDTWDLELRTDDDVRLALTALAAARVSKFEHVKPSLHQIFVETVGHAEIAARRPEGSRA